MKLKTYKHTVIMKKYIMDNQLGTIHEDEEFVSPIDMNDIMNKIIETNKEDDVFDEENKDIPFNIDDYKLADEEIEFGKHINLLNIFTCYYKKLFERKEHEHMFEGTNPEIRDSTNRCIEFLYEEIFKFNKSDEEDKDVLYEPDDDNLDINKCKELYILCIDNSPVLVCKFLLPILQYLGEQDWLNIEWSIMPLKN